MSSRWGAAGLVVAATALRALVVASVDLGDDEAYYWLWSQRPSLSYFDHPGAVAWTIAVSTSLLGDSALAVRLPSLVASGLTAWVVGALAETLQPGRRLLGVGLGLLVPVLGLVAVFAAPDALLLLVWALVAWQATRLSTEPGDHPAPPRWLVLGGTLGAALLCKLTGALLAVGLLGWSLQAPRRHLWRTAGPWLAVAAAGLVSAPTWIGLAAWGFDSLRFHAIDRHGGGAFGAGLGVFLVAHGVLLLPGVIRAAMSSRDRPHLSLLVWLGTPCWTVFALGAALAPAKLHWWTPAWLCMLPIAAAAPSPRLRRALWAGAALQAFVLFQARTGALSLPGDVTRELRGWPQAVEGLPLDRPLVTTRYQTAAQLAWALRDTPQQVHRVSGRSDQFTRWRQDRLPAGPLTLVCASHLPCRPRDIPGLVCDWPKTTWLVHRGRRERSVTTWACGSPKTTPDASSPRHGG